ncbi:hypothetical protein B0H16DRAFT_1476497 [Mycena metata]|uniref:F-box domain-containing protein n=1 Tax=Mycena metata TaxID=1033252 RepID=A0AAD7HCT5_9AGAR|nr:hypothetical protein B0H16DRAFT_1476497 [Mycena metata]
MSELMEDFVQSVDQTLLHSGLSDAYLKRISIFNIYTSSVPFGLLATEILADILLAVPTSFDASPREFKRVIYLLSTSTDLDRIPEQLRRCGAAPLVIYLAMLPSTSVHLPREYTAVEEEDTTETSIAESDIIRTRYLERWTTTLELLGPKLSQCRHFHIHTTCDVRTQIIFEVLSHADGSAISCLYFDVTPASLEDQRNSPLPLPFNGNTPALDGMILRDVFVCGLAPLAKSVTCLALWTDSSYWQPTVRELFDLLRAMPALVDLSMSNIALHDVGDVSIEDRALELPMLTDLFFCGYDHTSFDAFGSIRMPTLNSLHLVISPEEVDEFVKHWRQTTSHVGALALEFTATPSVGSFVAALAAFPKLQLLDCRNSLAIGLHLNAMVLHWTDLCPVLRCIWLDEELHDRVVAGILKHATASHFGADLRMVTLRGHDLDGSLTIPYESKLEDGNFKSTPAGVLKFSPYHFNFII